MNTRDIAKSLIQAVKGVDSEENIIGVLQVFDGIEDGMNLRWEAHLLKNLEETILYAKLQCKCGREIKFSRTGNTIEYEIRKI